MRTRPLRTSATLAAALALGALAACGRHSEHGDWYDVAHASPTEASPQTTFAVPPPPFSSPDIFPCTQCHDNKELVTDPKRRELGPPHDDIRLHHAENDRWCLDCHDATERDRLRLANGDPVDFKESYRLCGQCHGPQYRDWKVGVHGRRTGDWNGRKEYLLCVHCHSPHDPKFKPRKPLPPPKPPRSGS